MSVIEIESEDQFSSITNEAHQLVVIYFHTPWAAPCQQMAAVFDTLAAAHAGAKFVLVNADDHAEISELFEVSAVPYFVLVRDAVILRELSGADPRELAAAVAEAAATDAPAAGAAAPAAAAAPAPTASSAAAPADAAESPEALNARLAKLVAAAPVMLFMKGSPLAPQCGFLRQLVAILREHQVRFGFFDILKDDAVRQGLKTFSDWPTFPQLYVKGELQGGLDIVKELLEDDPDFFAKATEA